jgi:hypothetical protein
VLFLNVSAGIGMIGMASPMLQEVFAGSLIGRPDISFTHLNDEQRRMVATIGTLVLTVFGHLDFSLRVGTTGSHVPYKSLFRLRRRLYAGCRSDSLQDGSPTDPGSEGRRFGAGSQVQASNHCLENASPNHPGLEGDTYPIDGIGGLHVQKSPNGISDRTGATLVLVVISFIRAGRRPPNARACARMAQGIFGGRQIEA